MSPREQRRQCLSVHCLQENAFGCPHQEVKSKKVKSANEKELKPELVPISVAMIEATRSIYISPWMGCLSIAGLPHK